MDETSRIRRFEVLFDHAEPSPIDDEAYAPYGNFGFPPPPADRPWMYSNFVQSLDGITTPVGQARLGRRYFAVARRPLADGPAAGARRWHPHGHEYAAGGAAPARSPEPGHCLPGCRSRAAGLAPEAGQRPRAEYFRHPRGRPRPVAIQGVRRRRRRCRDPTSPAGAERLRAQGSSSHVVVLATGEGETFDLAGAISKLRADLGIEYLLCEGGPTLYGSLARAGLVDEKFLTVSPVEVGQQVPAEQERLATEPPTGTLLRPTVFGGPGFSLRTSVIGPG